VQFARYAHMAGLHGIAMGFADSLLLEGAGREAVLAAIAPSEKRLPEPLRAQSSDLDRAALDVLDGDFSSSAARLRRVYDDLVASRYSDRWFSVSLLVAGLRESGDPAGAARVATQLRNRLPGLPKDLATDDLALIRDPLPFLVDAQYRGASITREQRDAARSEWLARWKETVIGAGYLPYVWLHGYAAHVETAEEANEALAALPAWGGLPPFPQYTAANYSLGRMYLLAGRRDEALRYLKLAAKSCSPFEIPFEFVRSHLSLGIALADSGDKAGACDELAEVVKRWGNAKPKSVSAIDAKKRASALGCP
jgi:tetratricopeptide (TPR) repeat protein